MINNRCSLGSLRWVLCLLAWWLASGGVGWAVLPDSLHIYIDADWSSVRASSVAIEQGILTALDEEDARLGGLPVKIIAKNHRGNSLRSKRHLEQFLADDRALVLFSGLHSPPLLAHRDYINQKEILVLDPWAAAGPITRYDGEKNWIFRLSIDDTKAGEVIVNYAINHRGFKRPYLLLEDTGWGQSNQRTMGVALNSLGIQPVGIQWFNWGMSPASARMMLRAVKLARADVILLVCNASEGKLIIDEMRSLGLDMPICSHWGITGSDFPKMIGMDQGVEIDLAFIQTRFSFVGLSDNSLGKSVLQRAQKLFPTVKSAQDMRAVSGFVHAYDLTRILLAAVDQIGLRGDIVQDRDRLRAALENLSQPVEGLIKTYHRPFRPFSKRDPDAHEALGIKDYLMARYNQDGVIHLLEASGIEQ
ncbi:MAG: ABC transporter substrate-binding protein [Candidatus Latescibacteria bacterium]|jgi:branched-chain amino acid transport system substrate-binding protein|nr:ABC transporter substrate-binding protein [Candidatus Latescibacterota bacterium]MBT5829675.1 ABC transporter substrate-binding protein [Candidatus Latescibacterota bacterium]